MDIALDKVCELILRAKAVDVKEGVTDPDSGSNPIDDGSTDVLIDGGDDLTESEMRDVIAGLNDDERHDLVALARELRAHQGDPSGHLTPERIVGDGFGERPEFSILLAVGDGAPAGYA